MRRLQMGLIPLLVILILLWTDLPGHAAPLTAYALPEGRSYDQAHNLGYIDWSGSVQYVSITHRDGTSLPPEEGGTYCGSGCSEQVTRLGNGAMASGSLDRDVSYFEVMVEFTREGGVGTATLQACSASMSWNLYNNTSLPGFVSMILSVPAGCRSWALSASGGFVDFRSLDVEYIGAPSTLTPTPSRVPTRTATRLPTLTPTRTATRTPTATSTRIPTITSTFTSIPTWTMTSTFTPSRTATPTNTKSPTATMTFTPSATFTETPSPTPTRTATTTMTFTPSATFTETPSPTSTRTATATMTFTPSATFTETPSPTSTQTATATMTFTPTATFTYTPSVTAVILPPQIIGVVTCDLWGDSGWCRGRETLALTASDPQGFDVTIAGDLNGEPFACDDSCDLPLPEGIGTANYTVTSTSGQTAIGTSTWQRDGTPPELVVGLPPVNGRNGWYVSEVDLSATATDAISGLSALNGSLDAGATWISFPLHFTDGKYQALVHARDVAGNEVTVTRRILVDTAAPIVKIDSHSNTDVVQGDVQFSGSLEDLTSGPEGGEISMDGGNTWQTVSINESNWSFIWRSGEVPNGEYNIQIRGLDHAGNDSAVSTISLTVDNAPPAVSITERWWIWETGTMKVSPIIFRL